MGMTGGPGEHRKRNAEIVVPARRALVDSAAFTIFELKIGQLLIGTDDFRAFAKSHPIGLKFAVKRLDQEGPAHVIDREGTVWDGPNLRLGPSDHTRAKDLDQVVRVGGIISEDRQRRARWRGRIQIALAATPGLQPPKQPLPRGAIAADHRSRAVAAAPPTSWAMIKGQKPGQLATSIGLRVIGRPSHERQNHQVDRPIRKHCSGD
jgi:hypothetical protein